MGNWTWKKFFKSRLFFVVGIFVLAMLSYELTRAQLKDREIRAETRKLQEEADSLTKERTSYEQLIALLQTPDFLEKEARRSLGYTKPGEQVVVIEENKECKMKNEKCADGEIESGEISNLRKWWVYFFED